MHQDPFKLTVHQSSLGALGGARLGVDLDHTRRDHLVIQVVTLTRALTDTGEHGETTVVHGHVVDQLHDHDSLADTGTTEQTDLASLGVGADKVDDLDTRREDSVCA